MKLFFALALFALAAALEIPPPFARHGVFQVYNNENSNDLITSQVLNVPLDHFNSSNKATLPLRFWIDSSCYKKEGPVFFHMGGEAEGSPAMCGSREEKFGALVVSYEHRFYGQSLPEGELSDENMWFLSVEQNLADAEMLVRKVKETHTEAKDAKVIAFGGSYSGATCAWFRIAYPSTINGCVSSSGVINAVFEFTGFDEVIGEATKKPDPKCSVRIAEAFAAVDRAFDAGTGDDIKSQFNASNLINTTNGDADFFYGIADGTAMLVQYGQKKLLCQVLSALTDDASDEERIANLGEAIREGYGPDFVSNCYYDSECLKKPAAGAGGVGNRQWRWQKCSQLAYLQTAPKDRTPMRSRKLTLEALLYQCEYIFGAGMTPDTAEFNHKYGGADPQSSNIFFLDFSDDPWQRASVNHTLSESMPYCMTTCDGCGHCGAGVPASLMKTCDAQVDLYIKKWVQ